MIWTWISAALAATQPAVPVAGINGANLQRPVWSPDGQKLSYEANFHDDKRIELFVGDPGARDFAKVGQSRAPTAATTGFRVSGSGQVVHEISFAPDAARGFVYSASTAQHDYELFLATGSVLAPSPGADGGARWSPDGRWLVFTSARSGEGDLYLLEAAAMSKPPRRLTSQPDSTELYADWSPDGQSLVYVAHSAAGDNVWMLPSFGAQPLQLTSWPGHQVRPRYSPDGKRITFYANHENPDRFDLYVLAFGGAPQLLTRGVHPDLRGPAWTPDGQHIVFVARDDARFDPVCAVRVNDPSRHTCLPIGTVGNGDLDLAVRNGVPTLAVVAQGLVTDVQRDFKRLFVVNLPPLP